MKLLQTLRYTAIIEGISYLAFAITMPLKYVWEIKLPNYIVGQIHGIVFIIFCALVIVAARKYKWSLQQALILFVSALIPFGTFWTEKKYLRGTELA